MKKLLLLAGVLTLTACTSPSLPVAGATPTVSGGVATAGVDVCRDGKVVYCAINPAVSQGTIHSTICVSGWTSTIRPPVSYTEPLKKQMIALYANQHVGDANWTLSNTEEDHRLSLELGGAPKDPNNLAPEEHVGTSGSLAKDKDENAFNRAICNGSKTLVAAQREFIAKWLGVYPAFKDGKTSG